MKKVSAFLLLPFVLCVSAYAQSTASPDSKPTVTIAEKKPANSATTVSRKARGPVFRPTKDQVKEVQAMLKTKNLYSGEATGTYNDETRTGIKSFQKDNGLKQTGTLNRATLEKMGIELTDNQKAIPVSEGSFAKEGDKAPKAEKAAGETKPKKVIFRATKDQVSEAQKLLKAKSLYSGEETGKLDDATRDGLKKFQEANEIKVTGTLNKVTLEKLGIELTDKQKGQ